MALVVKDRVRETTTTTGTGTVTLAGAVAGFQSFSVIGNGNTTYYTITNNVDWEVGIGTYTSSGTTLSRDTILESSNGGTAVNFGAGTKDVFVTYPAEKSISDGYGLLPVANGGTGTNTAFTAGSVVFAGTSGVYTQDNANLFWDDTNNRLGIGASSPGTRLQVRDTAAPSGFSSTSVRVTRDNYGADFVGYIDQGVGHGAIISTVNNGTPTERMRINSSGNVGIGTSSPSVRLDIRGGDLQVSRAAAGVAGDAAINFGNSTANYIYSGNSSNIMAFATSGSERLRIDSSGNVGIGTSSPAQKLDVSGAANSTQARFGATANRGLEIGTQSVLGTDDGSFLNARGAGSGTLIFKTESTERVRIESNGNVGIGTSAAYGGRVNVVPASTPTTVAGANQVQIGEATANTAYRLQLGYLNDATAGYVSSVQSYAGGSAAALILNGAGGNVGIGTSSPGQKLTVAGTVESTSGGFKFPDGTTQTTGALEQVDIFTSSGTYTKPSWAKTIEVICIGGGGGGGSGRKGANGAARCGGGGGTGSTYTTASFTASSVGSTETVTIGSGGTGGASQTTNSTDGNAGTAGGTTSFGTKLYAIGGSGGGAGLANSGAAGSTSLGLFTRGATPGNSTTTVGTATNVLTTNGSFINPSSGGAGGPVTSANAAIGGGQGVNTTSGTAPAWKTGVAPAPTNSSVIGAGNSGTDNATSVWIGGESGDGGGASTTGNAGAGGNGGKWGGGGGGGGASVDNVGNSGAGGNGADGICIVISRG